MKLRVLLVLCLLVSLLAACDLVGNDPDHAQVTLAEFTESYVHVLLELERTDDGQAILLATFTPTEADAHLYSKDLPREGINGLGRPTLLELPQDALMQAVGALQDSVPAETDPACSETPSLPLYPAGAVTLSLPVSLPSAGGKLVNDQVLVTYMACTETGCHAPVIGKTVDIQIPGK
jgi:hypothetical protein